MESFVKDLVKKAKKNSYLLSTLSAEIKKDILFKMADFILQEKEFIIQQNLLDVKECERKGAKRSLIDRLTLNEKRLKEMSLSLREIAHLPDSVNQVIKGWQTSNGLSIYKVKVPIGVILIVYEARPNVTSDCIGLCFKSSNIAILKGGSEALNSNKAISQVLKKAAFSRGIDFEPFFFIETTSHEVVDLLLKESEYIDLVIPRGGESLIRKVVELSRIPVIKHYKGVCHIFVDEFADWEKALKICINAKVQRPSVCNAVETILIHRKIAPKFLPQLEEEFGKYGVVIKADEKALSFLKKALPAKEEDWVTEYLDLTVSIKVVENIDEAIEHINLYGSHHTDSIITQDVSNSRKFVEEVDSACCFVNISTRFSDGYQFGLGAEIGISTDKLHARGPMGIEELTTYKYVVYGEGQLRQ